VAVPAVDRLIPMLGLSAVGFFYARPICKSGICGQ
jgi:hypothetical protein